MDDQIRLNNNKFSRMACREGEGHAHRFLRYLHTSPQETTALRGQIIPNRILLSDHSVLTSANTHKKRKLPLFTRKLSPKQHPPEGNIFTNRGIIAHGGFEGDPRGSLSRITLKSQRKKTESSLSLFNRLILTPFNFVRNNNPPSNTRSSSTLREKKVRLQTPKSKPKSAEKGKRPPVWPCHRTLEEWSRGERYSHPRTEQRQSFVGWQTATLQGEDSFY